MNQVNNKKDQTSEVRVVVEVDGNPVGFLNLDIDRLWPLINHRQRESLPVEWLEPQRLDSVIRAAAVKNLMNRLQSDLYQALGNEIVKAELDIESFRLKAEAAAQIFGRTQQEIENLVAESGRTAADFYAFFWEYLLDDREPPDDLKKQWKAAKKESAAP
jgi:hypothetical protein